MFLRSCSSVPTGQFFEEVFVPGEYITVRWLFMDFGREQFIVRRWVRRLLFSNLLVLCGHRLQTSLSELQLPIQKNLESALTKRPTFSQTAKWASATVENIAIVVPDVGRR
jgi:hypothetical protein